MILWELWALLEIVKTIDSGHLKVWIFLAEKWINSNLNCHRQKKTEYFARKLLIEKLEFLE